MGRLLCASVGGLARISSSTVVGLEDLGGCELGEVTSRRWSWRWAVRSRQRGACTVTWETCWLDELFVYKVENTKYFDFKEAPDFYVRFS